MKGLIFTYSLTYGGAIASFLDPFTGLLIYICFAILKPEFLWFWAVPEGNYSRIVALAMLFGWAAHGFGRWQFGRARAIFVCLAGFLGWAILSALNAPDRTLALAYVEDLSKIVLPFVVGLTVIETQDQLRKLAWVIVLSQAYVAWEMNLSYLGGYNRIYFDGFAGMDNNSVAIAMVTGVGLAFFLAYGARRWWQAGLAIFCVLVMLHATLLSYSRGGMLAIILTAAISFFLIPRRTVHYVIFFAVVLIGLRLSGPGVVARFNTVFADGEDRDYSAQSRLQLWSDCLKVMESNPLLGLGPNHWPRVAAEYGWPSGKEAHSLWMQTGAELGFPGVGFLALFYAICVRRLWPFARSGGLSATPWLNDAARMTVASIVGFAVAAQFVSLWALEIPYYVVLLGAAALKLLSAAVAPASEPAPAPAPMRVTGGGRSLPPTPATAVRAGRQPATLLQRSVSSPAAGRPIRQGRLVAGREEPCASS
ncbi:MAG TPA: O-antigen ligase family protein [Candidatus Acidoferrum sp.]|nr:O-antigen ligase family protein [Candidatus Acidoferrum sp.]